MGDMGEDRSRLVASGRGWSHLLDIGDVLGDGGRGDEIFLAERCFDPAGIEVAFGAITLHAPRCARMARVVVALQCVFDGKGIFAVGSGRGL